MDDLPLSKSGSSILPIACIEGPGSYGARAFRFAALPPPDALSPSRLRPLLLRIIGTGIGDYVGSRGPERRR